MRQKSLTYSHLFIRPPVASAGTGLVISELEGKAGHFLVLLLGELVLESGEELRIDLQDETLDVLHDWCKVLLSVVGMLLHLFVPHVDLLLALGSQNEARGGQLTCVVLKKRGIEKSDLLKVLREEKDFILVTNNR